MRCCRVMRRLMKSLATRDPEGCAAPPGSHGIHPHGAAGPFLPGKAFYQPWSTALGFCFKSVNLKNGCVCVYTQGVGVEWQINKEMHKDFTTLPWDLPVSIQENNGKRSGTLLPIALGKDRRLPSLPVWCGCLARNTRDTSFPRSWHFRGGAWRMRVSRAPHCCPGEPGGVWKPLAWLSCQIGARQHHCLWGPGEASTPPGSHCQVAPPKSPSVSYKPQASRGDVADWEISQKAGTPHSPKTVFYSFRVSPQQPHGKNQCLRDRHLKSTGCDLEKQAIPSLPMGTQV